MLSARIARGRLTVKLGINRSSTGVVKVAATAKVRGKTRRATCNVRLPGTPTVSRTVTLSGPLRAAQHLTLTASYAGNDRLLPASATRMVRRR